ncbi:hypothetical protein G6321_00015390 [Bradyrhizobium barranii subsp. barranii]|uniref:Restriction endonuclease n=2 Tax=Bradyrhizobium barranii subsp. barranii TaxID=2823807 RepID=A0A9X9YZT8_9BRAD|nr:hypothetical protein [Bradyrhizobium barranii]UGX96443.1 hypothetical protein G6321_00015390 [Bradyrhizobium barranii subsp. barranii]
MSAASIGSGKSRGTTTRTKKCKVSTAGSAFTRQPHHGEPRGEASRFAAGADKWQAQAHRIGFEMSKAIATVGISLAEGFFEYFRSSASLLDYDIILFRPDIASFTAFDSYQGLPSYGDDESFELRRVSEHWRLQIREAFDHGKTIVVFLPPEQIVFIASGTHEYKGKTRIRHVESYSSFHSIPVDLKSTNASGREMTLTPKGSDALKTYWSEFGAESEYNVTWDASKPGTCLTTRVGNKGVGAIMRSKTSRGALVLLPDLDFDSDKDGDQSWSTAGKRFTQRLLSSIVELDKALKASSAVTPAPSWATDPSYSTEHEKSVLSELIEAERAIESAQKHRDEVAEKAKAAGHLRALLYETGKILEHAIIEALKVLGFSASSYREGDSEFDVVFECPEGRLMGEAEGKDTKAINIDKLRQLSLNIHEDLNRDEVKSPAKGVLFGNGYRLTAPASRGVQFTEKCIMAAKSTSTALIATTELFKAAHYLSDHKNPEYAELCRRALLQDSGLISLPSPPSMPQTVTETTAEVGGISGE